MNRMNVTCGKCAGMGRLRYYKVVSEHDGVCGAVADETVCDTCGGKGYTEYAVFSIEEAEAILKHCGLSVEGGD